MSAAEVREAIGAWIHWRQIRYHAIESTEGEDALLAMLRDWMRREGLVLLRLSDRDGRRVLDRIAAMEWDCRPFEEAELKVVRL